MKASHIDPPPRPRGPWQWLYGTGHRLRYRWYRRRAQRLPKPVVSVGNLHWGGGGKTPLVAATAAWLRDADWKVAILSRGYKSRGEGVRVVSRGEGPLLGPMVAGDEPVLLAGQLPGVAVLVCPDRYHAGRQALYRLDVEPDVFLLDDGFSHLRLHRDLDVLTFPAADTFGGGRLAPSGRLREPLAAAARADAVVMSGVGVDAGAGRELATALRAFGFQGPGFSAPVRAETPRRVPEGDPVALDGRRVLLVSAVARPQSFADTARGLGAEIAGDLRFPDHHPYPDASLDEIRRALRQHDAELVLVTSKDRVKLQGRLELPLAELPIRAEPEAAFFEWLETRLAADR
jgi:tetraacyldisaccharide 4'-kinase